MTPPKGYKYENNNKQYKERGQAIKKYSKTQQPQWEEKKRKVCEPH